MLERHKMQTSSSNFKGLQKSSSAFPLIVLTLITAVLLLITWSVFPVPPNVKQWTNSWHLATLTNKDLGCREILEAGTNIKVDFDGTTFKPKKAGKIELRTFDRTMLEMELLKTRRVLGRVPYIVFTGDSNQMFRQNALFTLLETSNGRRGLEWATYVQVKTNDSLTLAEIQFIPGSSLENPVVSNVRGNNLLFYEFLYPHVSITWVTLDA
jgi:hypothetical protein